MEKRTAALLVILLVGVIGISLVGCAGSPTVTATAKTLPEMLKEAGFKVHAADTPQQMAHLRTCPADTLMIHERQGNQCYAFSDPTSKCMYLGDAAAYQRFRVLLEKQEKKVMEQRSQDDPEFWTNWGHKFGGG